MNIILYKYSGEFNRVDKSSKLTTVLSTTGTLREPCSVEAPQLTIQYTGFPKVNYLYIAEFERYYFIKDIVSIRKNLWLISCEVDVLHTYRVQLTEHSAIVKRTNINSYIWSYKDELIPVFNVKNTIIVPLGESIGLNPNTENANILVSVTGTIDYTINDEDSIIEQGVTIPSNAYVPTNRGSTTYLFKDYNEFKKFVNSVVNDSALTSHILSIIAIPLYGMQLNAVVKSSIKVGSTDISCNCFQLLTRVIQFQIPAYLSSNQIPNGESAMSREPYCSYEIYIPYYGWVEIESRFLFNQYETVNNRGIIITFSIDPTNGSCICVLSKKGSNYIIKTITFKLGQDIPISSTGLADIERKNESNMIRYDGQIAYLDYQHTASQARSLASAGSAVMNIAGGLLSGNVGMAFTGFGQAMSTAGNLVAKEAEYMGGLELAQANYDAQSVLNVPYGSPNISASGYLSMFFYDEFKIRISVSPLSINQDQFAKYRGYIYNQILSLSACKGFTQLADIRLNISGALAIELRELYNALLSGVIFDED